VGTKIQSWWRKIYKPLDSVIITVLVILAALLTVIILGHIFNWNWLQPLIIPAVLAITSYLFTYSTIINQRKATKQRDQNEQNSQFQATLKSYQDKISELLLEKNLRGASSTSDVRHIARFRTLTTLACLDQERKRSLLQFLQESGLIHKDKVSIDLSQADLNDAHLSDLNLLSADLSGANLINTDLSRAYLFGTNLSRSNLILANLNHAKLMNADLSWADLTAADLSNANLTGACLVGTCLFGTNLSNAKITDEQLD
jgi:uncharacterized protein YjbI with pentapeptide repeats